MISKAQGASLFWDDSLGWLVESPDTLPREVLQSIAAWAVPHQIDRWRSLPPGDKKDGLKRAIDLLQQGKIQQYVEAKKEGNVIFASTERMHPEKSYFFGNEKGIKE